MDHKSLFSLSCIALVILTSCAAQDPLLKTFTDTTQHQALLVAVHKTTGDVFMATRDNLYHLDADLVLKKKVTTGPHGVFQGGPDRGPCPGTTCTNRTLDRNVPIAMSIVYHTRAEFLMLCGTLYDGLCQLRPLYNLDLDFWIGPYDDPVGRCVMNKGDLAFFGPGYGNRVVLYSGTGWQPGSGGGEALPWFSSKVLEEKDGRYRFRYSYQSTSSLSAVFINYSDKKHVLHSFIHGSYVYVLFVRETQTVLSRLCLIDGSLTSYIEQPLACGAQAELYTIATAAFFGPGLHWVGGGFRPMEHLYVSYAKSVPLDTINTLTCYYSVEFLNRVFDAAIDDCFRNGSYTYRLDLDTGRLLPCNRKEDSDICGGSTNPYIYSQQVASRTRDTIKVKLNSHVSSLAVFEQDGVIVGFLGTKGSYVKRFVAVGVGAGATLHEQPEEFEVQPSLAFDLKKEHIYYLTHNKIVKYPIRTCSLHKTCEKCFGEAFAGPLRCGWCNGQCVTQQECQGNNVFSRENCSPTIYSVRPLIGSTRGGTHLTIVGKNFGRMSGLDTFNAVSINKVPCEIILWESERVICVTLPSPKAMAAPVDLIVRDVTNKRALGFAYIGKTQSDDNFGYVETKLISIEPDRGSVAGGTAVRINGTHLDMAERYRMNVGGRVCTDLKINKWYVLCVTGNSTLPSLKKAVELKMDNVYIEIERNDTDPSEVFLYLPDPVISGMHPTATVLSYSNYITVTGQFLDSAKHPFMLVNIQTWKIFDESEKTILKQKCWQNSGSNGTSMTCSTPVLDSEKFPFPKNGQPLVAQVSFDMYPFREKVEIPLELSFYPEPEFQEIQTLLDNQTSLEIKGKYPGAGSLSYLTSVQIGENEPCNISELTSDTLHCEFRPELLTDESVLGKNLTVKVTRGSSHHIAGYLVIKDPREGSLLAWPVAVALALALFVVAATAAWCCFRRLRRDKSSKDRDKDPAAVEFNNRYTKEPMSGQAKSAPSLNDAQKPLMATSQPGDTETDNQPDKGDGSFSFRPPVEWQQMAAEETMSLDDTLRTLAKDGWIIQEDHLTLGDVVGAGNYGSVFKGQYNSPKYGAIEVAVKTIHGSPDLNQTSVCEFLKEGGQMRNFKHDNVLPLIGFCFDGDLPMIVVPFMHNGDLCSYLRNQDNNPSQEDRLGFAVQIAAGMEYLAQEKFVHRDLAARNCLISSDMTVKVSDFGLSRDIYESDYYRVETKSRELPFGWMAPECLELGKFTEKSDVWSYGVVLWELMTRGETPYDPLHHWGIMEFLKIGGRLRQPTDCPENIYRVMQQCWESDPSKRPSFAVLHGDVTQLWKAASCKEPLCAQNQLYFGMED